MQVAETRMAGDQCNTWGGGGIYKRGTQLRERPLCKSWETVLGI